MPVRKPRNWNVLVMTSPRRLQPGRLPSSRWIAMSDKRSAISLPLRARRLPKKLSSRISGATLFALSSSFLIWGIAPRAGAQLEPTPAVGYFLSPSAVPSADTYWRRFALGFGASILAHESAHVLSSLLMGFHPYIGLDRGRPTIFSGIDSRRRSEEHT